MTFKVTQPPLRSKFDKENGVNTEWAEWTKRVYTVVNSVAQSGTTANRPEKIFVGQQYFDTTLNLPIWVNAAGTGWIKSDGTAA